MIDKVLFTTISSGKFKGKKVFLPSLTTTRSTKSIVKESFFNTIQNQISDKIFIEVFGGSALMAIQALSNGAKKAYAIEIDRAAYKFAQRNIVSLNSPDIVCINADTFEKTPNLVMQNDNIILYIDPPFDIRDGFEKIYDRVWSMLNSLIKTKLSLVVFEHISSYDIPFKKNGFIKIKSRKFGKSTLSYYIVEKITE